MQDTIHRAPQGWSSIQALTKHNPTLRYTSVTQNIAPGNLELLSNRYTYTVDVYLRIFDCCLVKVMTTLGKLASWLLFRFSLMRGVDGNMEITRLQVRLS